MLSIETVEFYKNKLKSKHVSLLESVGHGSFEFIVNAESEGNYTIELYQIVEGKNELVDKLQIQQLNG